MKKLVSIITPTIPERRELLVKRCIPSVASQTYDNIEHIIIQDGPSETIPSLPLKARWFEMGRNWREFVGKKCIGGVPRKLGTMVARGDYIGYLDDDDEFLPEHVEKLVNLLESSGKDFVFSRFKQFFEDGRTVIIGDGKVEFGRIGTPSVIHKVECLLYSNWQGAIRGEDFNLFSQWTATGRTFAHLAEVTVNVYRTRSLTLDAPPQKQTDPQPESSKP